MDELKDEDGMTLEHHSEMMRGIGFVLVYTPEDKKELMGEVMWVRPETVSEFGYRLYRPN
jgi:hypothetical protein